MRIFTTILFYSLLNLSFGQYRFDHLGINDGLSQSSVNDIFQDSNGFMWFATQDGLNKFDGYEFVQFNKETKPPLAGNFLWNIVEDPNGNIWTASATGATRLDWKRGKSTRFYYDIKEKNLSAKNQVGGIVDLGNKMLIAFDGRGSFTLDYDAFMDSTEMELTDEQILHPKNIHSRNYLYDVFNINEKKISIHYKHLMIDNDSIPLPKDSYTSVFKRSVYDFGNGFLLGTKGGLLFADLANNKIVKTSVKEPVNDIIPSPKAGVLWLATDRGIINYDPISDHYFDVMDANNNSYLFSSLIMTIHQSRDGLFWIGTANGGINIYDPMKNRFKFLNQAHGLNGKPIWSIEQSKNELFVGSDDGLYLVKLKCKLTEGNFARDAIDGIQKIKIPNLSDTRVTAIKKVTSNEIILGTASGEIAIYNTKTGAYRSKSLPNSPIISSIILRNDLVWVTTHQGIYQLSKELDEVAYLHESTHPEFNTSYFLSSYITRDGTIWLGSNTGFSRVPPSGEVTHIEYDENKPKESPNHYFITGFYEDKNGLLWMSTFGGGVSCFDRSTKQFSHVTTKNGLLNNTCASIQGNDSHLFVGTNGGLSVIEIASRTVINYTKEDGILSNEFAIASSMSNGSEFFFGSIDGVIAFKGALFTDEIVPPQASITNLDVNYSPVNFSTLDSNELNLYPSDKIFSLSFSDLSYRKRDQVTYEYKLKGFNPDWIAVNSSNRRATYSLSPDQYEFQVRTVLGAIKSDPTSLSIIVHPAFYQTWWFIAFSSMFGIGLVVLASRYYSHQSLKGRLRKLEVQQKIQSERERISRDLHDNVGSQITYIASSLDNLSSNGDVSEVKELGEFTRDTMRQLRETIWVINHDEVSVEELKNKVIDYLSEILKNFPEIVLDVSFPESDLKFNPTKAINIFRIVQEAVNNTVKHAEPKKIEVQLLLGEECSIAISDDGKGFSGEEKSGHFGLMNMRSRAQEIGGSLQLKSSPGLGTSIIVSGFKIGQMT